MRILTDVSIVILALASQAAQAQGQAARGSAAGATATKPFNAEESAAMADAQRAKSERLERTQDEKLKRTTKSICVGC